MISATPPVVGPADRQVTIESFSRLPDTSGLERVPAGHHAAGYTTLVPDLVVEVVTPNDGAEDVERKKREYAETGGPLIWVVFTAAIPPACSDGAG